MEKLKVLSTMAAIMLAVALFGQGVNQSNEVVKFDFVKIWEFVKIASPYIAGLFLALFGASEGLAGNQNIKANSVKQFIWNIAFKLAQKQADKIKK